MISVGSRSFLTRCVIWDSFRVFGDINSYDQSKNVIVYGLGQKMGVDTKTQIDELFESLDLKLPHQSFRIHYKKSSLKTDMPRPIKVTMKNSDHTNQILRAASKLQYSEEYSKVFIKPDRTEEERRLTKIAEDRSKNVIMLGLSEEAGFDTNTQIHQVLEFLGEKTQFQSIRMGVKRDSDQSKPRPVKVVLSNAAQVGTIMKAAKRLKYSKKFSEVSITLDISNRERKIQKDTLKKKQADEPDQRHFISPYTGKVVTVSRKREPSDVKLFPDEWDGL